jgi:protocatechuate 4,5-dioxygenase, alpha chain
MPRAPRASPLIQINIVCSVSAILKKFAAPKAGHRVCREETAVMAQNIPGTIMFDGGQAQKGYALNRMCYSFNNAANRAAFVADEDAYCAKFGLTATQRKAVKSRDVLAMIEAGGNIYYLAKLAGIFGLNVQDIGAQQTGTTVDEFKAKLQAAGR